MKKFQSKHGHGFFTIACMLILLTIPGALCAATYYSDTDGDGQTETITTTSTEIKIYHPKTGSTRSYSYYSSGYSTSFSIISAIMDTDGQPGNELVVSWKETWTPIGGSTYVIDQGIDVIADRTGSRRTYRYYDSAYNMSYSIYAIADTDGQPGKEIIVSWKETWTPIGGSTYVIGQGIDIIHDVTQKTSNYAWAVDTSIQKIRDYDKIAGAEICYYNKSYSRYQLITDRTSIEGITSTCDNPDPYQPPVIAITPATGSSYAGYVQNFTAVYSDANGATNITGAYIGWRIDVTSLTYAIILYYDVAANNLYLYNDDATGLIGPCKPGSQSTLSNGQGTLNCAKTTVASSGKDLTINWNITPKTTYRGTKNMYFHAVDKQNLNSGIVQKNTWQIK